LSPIASLPPELYIVILTHIPPAELQTTAWALSTALPCSPIPLHHLYQHIHIDTKRQLPRLWRKLNLSTPESEDHHESNWIQSFELRAWDPDADVLVNTVQLIPQLQYLHLNIGTTFAPEHLEDLFKKPQQSLRLLSLRFRPYVEKATYYQFLKGSYSDSMIELLAGWPGIATLKRISIVQDPLPSGAFAPQTSFAQPIVFHSLTVLRVLSLSPLARGVTHLRLRVPARPVISQLISPGSFPALYALDLSTSSLADADQTLPQLVASLPSLRHLILDGCSLNREGWRELGRSCALAGLPKARAREKALSEWITANKAMSSPTPNDGDALPELLPPQNVAVARRPRRGRRGLAQSTVSLRSHSPPRRATPILSSSSTSAAAAALLPSAAKIRILPPVPRLVTLSTTLSPVPNALKRADWTEEFESGWASGMDTIRAVWARLRASGRTGTVRVMCFDEVASAEHLEG
ncbi:hypothetical protein BS47DRAFT_1280055, partial [Hydnum rufescens UP504]